MNAVDILCLFGSPTNREMAELSLVYTRGCIDALQADERFRFVLLHVAPGGVWSMPDAAQTTAIQRAPALSFAQAVAAIAKLPVAVGLPQMFCHAGMTSLRGLFDLLGIPYIGNPPVQMGLAADKRLARAVVAAAEVNVPSGIVVHADGPVPAVALPAIVKPAVADNSDGVSLVRAQEELREALLTAWRFGDVALVEDFIEPGRELRCGIIDRAGERVCLLPQEYPVDADVRPIRTRSDKLAPTADGGLRLVAKDAASTWIVAPDDPVVPVLHEAALRCYRALGCRQYGLFDFRIDRQNRAWFLEAGPYCSFSPQSVIVVMAEAAGISLPDLFAGMVDDARQEFANTQDIVLH
ncbi:hypothetical protein RM533_06880 [Croceicoccus sp. F390]|uniref:ATP-grasp domain-containing protein n=1 Tax=Croceicoccus esteveae TaxID=3075597 RepID=A0ABU2ZH22_9SPHN|nr:hypothetical protein [Croceicoccus sp. F390]MDT0575906.1 hypothetical protein [Croceicoccus sp. F390]